MHRSFKRQLFGYNRGEVDQALFYLKSESEKIGAQYEQRIAEIVEENVRPAVELKVARAGYQDAAEMMYAAQSRIRDLEKLLYEERERVGKLEQSLAEKNEKTQQDLELAVAEMKQRLEALASATGQMDKVLGDMGRVTTYYEDGTCFEDVRFAPPEGVKADALEEHSARGLMQRIYQIRQQEPEKTEKTGKKETEKTKKE